MTVTELKKKIMDEASDVMRRINSWGDKKLAIIPAGASAQGFYERLKKAYGLDVEFFIDNNKELCKKTISGKEVRVNPWQDIPNFGKEYAVIIATDQEKIFLALKRQLEENNVDDFCDCFQFETNKNIDKFVTAIEYFDDEESKFTYLGVMNRFLNRNRRFIRYSDAQYFAFREFGHPINEVVVDCGAFVGDSIEEYVRRAIGRIKIYAFEPMERNITAIKYRKNRLTHEWGLSGEEIVIIPAGVAETSGKLCFATTGAGKELTSGFGEKKLQVYSLDDFFIGKDEKPTVIKADIEGAELAMLKGARNLLIKGRPKLAISIYHSPIDMWAIPEYLKKLIPTYKMKVRTHSHDYWETILYCYLEE